MKFLPVKHIRVIFRVLSPFGSRLENVKIALAKYKFEYFPVCYYYLGIGRYAEYDIVISNSGNRINCDVLKAPMHNEPRE